MNVVNEVSRLARTWEIVQRLQELQHAGLPISEAGVDLYRDEAREAAITVSDWRFDRLYGSWLLAQSEETP